MYKNFFKRFLDFWAALIMFICIFPILFIVGIILAIANSGSPFFIQKRPGKGGKVFKIVKFKTMNDAKDENGDLLPDAKRLTKIGHFVRSTSIDELPQLINVIKGDMSFIGPRPLLMSYLPLYSEEQVRRHDLRPGITGWAQVNGRNLLKLSKKFEYDVWYVNNCSLSLDLKIIYLTIMNIINRKNIGTGAGNMKDIDDLGFKNKMIQNELNNKLMKNGK